MRCRDFDALVDLLEDLPPGSDAARHAASCAACRRRLALARAIDAALAAAATPEPPERFTAGVMGRIRQERWRAEQLLDTGFNVAVAAGVVLVFAGLAGLAWSTGLAAIGIDLSALAAVAASALVDRAAAELPTVLIALVLLTGTLGAWWWAEGDVPI